MTKTPGKINILFLGGAKRVSIGKKFIEAGKSLGLEVHLYSYELQPIVPIRQIADIILGKRWSDKGIYDDLHKNVEQFNIDVMIPFVDGAVEIAARYRDMAADVWVPVGSAEAAAAMFDKVKANALFISNNLPVPGNKRFPMISKPRFGSASKGISIIEKPSDLRILSNNTSDEYLLQEYIKNRDEITVDCYVALDGRFITAVPRYRLEVQGGEVTSTLTFRNPEVEALVRRTIVAAGLTGAITVQMLRDKDSGRLMLMEINPRLGGGAVAAVHAQANIPEFILRDATGLPLEPCNNWKENVLVTRWLEDKAYTLTENGTISGQ